MQTYCLNGTQINTLNSFPLANAYIPIQKFTPTVSPEDALKTGTAWAELYTEQKGDKN